MPIVRTPFGPRVVAAGGQPYLPSAEAKARMDAAARELAEEPGERVAREYLRAARAQEERRRAEQEALAIAAAEIARVAGGARAGTPIRLERRAVATSGAIQGYASVFGVVDSYGDIVERGAFAATIADHRAKGRSVPILWSHNIHEPIGLWRTLEEDSKGLWVEGEILTEVQRGREALALVESGALDGLSIGFSVDQAEHDRNGVRRLTQVKLWEVSLVGFPANDDARIERVQS
jgi:HK97 family phage prohead protease